VQTLHILNDLGLPIGLPVLGWTPVQSPPRTPMGGYYCRVEPLEIDRHAKDLFEAYKADTENRVWTYLAYGPFDTFDSYVDWMQRVCTGNDPMFFAVVKDNKALGVASYLRIDPSIGSIEVGHINFSPALQRTPASTEALYLMMKRAFTLGYRRYEWKCDALNAKSRATAQRLGLSYEGIFRQATVYKGRNRDTAWYAAIDQEWPALEQAFEQWLDPSNFDEHGKQRARLADLTRPILKQTD
jgi:RimJ/RimL family protein N-acetyltransferase